MDNTISNNLDQGTQLINLGKLSEAQQYYEDIVNNASKDLDSLYSLAYVHFAQHNYKKATEILKNILSINDKFDKAYYLLAKTNYTFTTNKEDMTNDILKALKLNPENSYYSSMAALIFYSTNNLTNAYKRATDAIHLDPTNYEANLVLGGYYQKSDKAKSFEYFKKALEYGAEQPESQFTILPLHLEITRTRKGLALIKEAYSKNKNNQAYRWLYKRAYIRNNFLNWPFSFVDNLTVTYAHVLFFSIILLTIIALMYSSEELTINIVEAFKWFCSLVLIIFVPYQVIVFLILQLYFECVVHPQILKAL